MRVVGLGAHGPGQLDALGARGYIRVSGWYAHITAAEVLRYFAAATVEIDETVT